MKIYLDVCCLNRPFDGTSQPRVALEAAAVARVLELIKDGRMVDYSSEMARVEIERILDVDRRRKVVALLPPDRRIMPLSDKLLDFADNLMKFGFELADAVHIAAAQQIGADVFLTVDDKLLNRAKKYVRRLNIRVIDPVSFLQELKDDDDG